MNRDEMIIKLNKVSIKLFEKFGTESYNERCVLHDVKEALKNEPKYNSASDDDTCEKDDDPPQRAINHG